MDQLILFFGTCLALSALPGPNNIVCFTHAVASGHWSAMVGALGRFPAYAIMIAAASFLFASAMTANDSLFGILQILGSAYMLYLGSRIIRSSGDVMALDTVPRRTYFVSEFLTALSNPKAIIVFAALFPNFLTEHGSILGQFTLLGAIAMVAEAAMALVYALAGSFIGEHRIPGRYVFMTTGSTIILMAVWLLYSAVFSFL